MHKYLNKMKLCKVYLLNKISLFPEMAEAHNTE